jgi:hypothetical protein
MISCIVCTGANIFIGTKDKLLGTGPSRGCRRQGLSPQKDHGKRPSKERWWGLFLRTISNVTQRPCSWEIQKGSGLASATCSYGASLCETKVAWGTGWGLQEPIQFWPVVAHLLPPHQSQSFLALECGWLTPLQSLCPAASPLPLEYRLPPQPLSPPIDPCRDLWTCRALRTHQSKVLQGRVSSTESLTGGSPPFLTHV